MDKEILQEIERTIKAFEDYENGYHEVALFEIEHIDKLLSTYKKQKEVIDTLKKYLTLNIELIKEQPSNDELTDNFILGRFKSLLRILEDKEVE